MIVKLIYSVNGHEFYTEYFEGENEVCLLPATSRILYISQDDLRAWCSAALAAQPRRLPGEQALLTDAVFLF